MTKNKIKEKKKRYLMAGPVAQQKAAKHNLFDPEIDILLLK